MPQSHPQADGGTPCRGQHGCVTATVQQPAPLAHQRRNARMELELYSVPPLRRRRREEEPICCRQSPMQPTTREHRNPLSSGWLCVGAHGGARTLILQSVSGLVHLSHSVWLTSVEGLNMTLLRSASPYVFTSAQFSCSCARALASTCVPTSKGQVV